VSSARCSSSIGWSGSVGLISVALSAARALQRAVDRHDGRVEQLGDLARLPVQDLAQDEHRPLARGQVLERGHEGEPDGLALGGQLRGVAVLGQDARVGDRLEPRGLGARRRERSLGGARGPEVHRPRTPVATVEHVHAHVRGDPVQPRPQRRAALEAVVRTPGADHRLLHGVLGLEGGPEHAVAVAGQLAAVLLEAHLHVRRERAVARLCSHVESRHTARSLRPDADNDSSGPS
jgi:hypothetical protein